MKHTSQEKNGGFEEFTGVNGPHEKKISIRKSGQIGINVTTVRAYSLTQYDGFVLHFNSGDSLIGLEPTDEEERDGFITAREHNKEIQVSAKSFFDHYLIPYDETRRAPVLRFDEEHNLIIADVSEIMGKREAVH